MKLVLRETTLPNGLSVVSSAMPHTYSVGVGFYLSVGSRYEEPATAGASHFVEHMIFKGTGKRPAPDLIAREIESRGGVFNASTGQELTTLWAKMQKAHLPVAMEVLTDMIRHSLVDAEEVEKERRVILEELLSSQDVPEELVGLVVQEMTWPDHPLGWDVAGTLESVGGIGREDLNAFLGVHYGPQNMVIAVAGDMLHDEVVELAAELTADWQPALRSSFLPAPTDDAKPRALIVRKKTEQSHFALHMPGLARNDPDRFAMGLVNVILGEGMSCRLFMELRERRGLAYSVDSYVSYLADTGIAGVYAAVSPDKLTEALEAAMGELVRMREELVNEETLAGAKEFLKGRMLMGLEDTLAVAGWYGRQKALGQEVLAVEEVLRRLDEVTPQDVQRVAQRVFTSAGCKLAVVGPHRKSETAPLEKLVQRGL